MNGMGCGIKKKADTPYAESFERIVINASCMLPYSEAV